MKNINPINLLWISGISAVFLYTLLLLCMITFLLIIISLSFNLAQYVPQFLIFEYKIIPLTIILFISFILYCGCSDAYETFFKIKNTLKEFEEYYRHLYELNLHSKYGVKGRKNKKFEEYLWYFPLYREFNLFLLLESNLCLVYKVENKYKPKRKKLIFYTDNNIKLCNIGSQYEIYRTYSKGNKIKELNPRYKVKNLYETANLFFIHIFCLGYLRNVSRNNMLSSFVLFKIIIIFIVLLIIGL